MRKPHLTFIIGQLQVGGAERHLSLISPKIQELGFKVSVYCLFEGGPLKSILEASNIEVLPKNIDFSPGVKAQTHKKALWLSRNALQLLLYLRRARPDIVHCFLPPAYMIAGPLAILSGADNIIMSRRGLNRYQEKYLGARWFESLLHKRMSAILGNSASVVSQLIEDENAPADKVGLIYNGIDLNTFKNLKSRETIRRKLNIDDETLIFAIVANLIPYKGHLDLFQALQLAKDRLPHKWALLVIGRDDGIQNDLIQYANQMHLSDHIHLLGSRSDVPNLLQASDIGLLTSHEEGFSNALLEGMAAGLPIIATDVGGNAEAVIHAQTGYIVPPHDPKALCKAILDLAGSPDLRKRLGQLGKQRVNHYFSLGHCIDYYVRLYTTLLKGESVSDLPGFSGFDQIAKGY